jgi:predicted regulator of Ras-like GTPase activity (Roadblock/LC7/MglB family)
MASFIKEIWLFTLDGLPIAEFCKNESIDKSIVGGLISAIKSVSHHLTSKGLQSLVLEDNKIVFFSALQGNVILVVRTDSQIKDKKINKLGVEIIEILEELYTADDIISWNGTVAFFNEFREKLKKFLKI